MSNDLDLFDCPEEVKSELLQTNVQPSTLSVLKENWTALNMFLISSTQINRQDGLLTGIHYPALESALRLSNIQASPEDFDRFRIVELEAIAAVNKRLLKQ